jgi:chaperonin GroES
VPADLHLKRAGKAWGKSTSVIGWHQVSQNPMKFRPLHDRVVIRRLNAEEKTTGGIIIPDTAQEKPMEGEVVAAGPGARNEQGQIVTLEVKAGDRILFGKWSGTEVKLDGEELLIMKESDIMGIIEGRPASRKKAA